MQNTAFSRLKSIGKVVFGLGLYLTPPTTFVFSTYNFVNEEAF